MSMLKLLQALVALALEFVTQRRAWKGKGKGSSHSNTQYTEFPKSWSMRGEREWQEMDYLFRSNRGERTQLQGMQTPYHWEAPPKYQLHQHNAPSVQRTTKRRVMVVSNPDPADDSEGELELKLGDPRGLL